MLLLTHRISSHRPSQESTAPHRISCFSTTRSSCPCSMALHCNCLLANRLSLAALHQMLHVLSTAV
jgi:hypothetical protein